MLAERSSHSNKSSQMPTISIVGKAKADRADIIEKLVLRFKSLGYRIAVVKHDVHGFEMDRKGKPTWRYSQAGSDVVIISSPNKMALLRQTSHELSLGEIEKYIRGCVDLLITDGYRSSDKPKIEVMRDAGSKNMLCSVSELVAMVSDHQYALNLPRFDWDDTDGLVEFIVSRFLNVQDDHA